MFLLKVRILKNYCFGNVQTEIDNSSHCTRILSGKFTREIANKTSQYIVNILFTCMVIRILE